jgi:hypothetical protein
MEKLCFVISPIGEEGSLTRKRSNTVLNYLVKPIADSFGYDTVRADQISQPGIITTQIIANIIDSHLIIADLTDANPNVFYELGICHTIRKPYIQLIETGQKLPFDILATRTIYYDLTDLEKVEKTKEELKKQIAFVHTGSQNNIDSPVSYSIDISQLVQSSKPSDKDISTYINLIQNLQLEMSNLTTSIKIELEEIRRDLNLTEDGKEKRMNAISKLDKIQKDLKSK